MIFWLILGVYLTGWLVTAPKMAEFWAPLRGSARCHREFTDYTPHHRRVVENKTSCQTFHAPACWHHDSEVKTVDAEFATYGALSALLWPLVAPVALTFYLAQPRPAKAMKSEEIARKIEQAERDLGIGQ